MQSGTQIDPFPTPDWVTWEGSAPDLGGITPVIFAVVFMVWIAYTLVVAYHWFRYGHRSFLAVPMLALHLLVSGTLLLLTATGA